jgi:hypothetical protein
MIGFEVLTAVVMKSMHNLLDTCFQTGFLPSIFLDPEDGGDIFLRNFG